MAHGLDRDATQAARKRRQGHGAARLAARARGNRADRRQSAAPPLHRHRRTGGHARRRAGADVRRRMFQLWRTHRARASLRPLGARSRPRQRRRRRPDDAEPAGIHGDLARPCQRRRRRFAHQHQSARPRARPLRRYRRTEARHRRCRACRRVPFRERASREPPENLVARQRRFRTHRRSGRAILGRAADAGRASRGDDRGPRAADLHIRHHRPAQGRQCQPPAAAGMELLVRRPDEHRAAGSHV